MLDKNPDVCMGISRVNTAVVYSGYDNKPGTMKAGFCVSANRDYERLAEELDVPFSRCGSLMTATGPAGTAVLEKKLEQGIRSSVPGLEIISPDEARQMVPGLSPSVVRALWAPTTGTVNPWSVGIAAAENAVQNGTELFLSSEVTKIRKTALGYEVYTKDKKYEARCVINCAGMAAARVSAMAGEPYFEIIKSKAEYLILDAVKEKPGHIVFQETEEGEGVTIVPTTEGSILIGATNSPYTDGQSPSAVSAEGMEQLKGRTLEIMPEIPLDMIIRSFAGLRPRARWTKKDTSMDSFYISPRPGSDDFIDLIGMKTPGLTCADKVGRHVAGMIIKKLSQYTRCGEIGKKPDFNPCVERRPRFSTLPDSEKLRLCEADAGYGRIICRCHNVTEAQVRASIAMRVGAKTVDGVKRRTGAGLGRCQGGFCTERVMELLSEELKVPFSSIEKDGPVSYLVEN